ncbi:MAG: hypothetical protein A4E26_01208 [Methanobacterium sp. PtaU1.Bin097]|nr:MAG: hypothetical protein A4E26_01208 [Methanobacterium sp. PtaU1.Bin097]
MLFRTWGGMLDAKTGSALKTKFESSPRALSLSNSSFSFSALFRSVISLKTRATPITLPFSSRIGALLSSMGNLVPSLVMSKAGSFISITASLLRTLVTGSSRGIPVFSFIIWKTSTSVLPMASSWSQPVTFRATGFMKMITPSLSVAITASPILSRVVESHFSLSLSLRSISCL